MGLVASIPGRYLAIITIPTLQTGQVAPQMIGNSPRSPRKPGQKERGSWPWSQLRMPCRGGPRFGELIMLCVSAPPCFPLPLAIHPHAFLLQIHHLVFNSEWHWESMIIVKIIYITIKWLF